VHARGQVCHIDIPQGAWQATRARSARASGEALVRRLAGVLPPDLVVARATEAPAGFDARFSASSRRYAYRLVDGPHRPDPLTRRHVAWHRRPVDIGLLAAASDLLLGEHDFAAYCRRREGATTLRRLLRLDWTREPAVGAYGDVVVATVEADAFCHAMVRSLVGALVVVGERRRPVGWPAEVLAGHVRNSAVQVAPARGLTLEQVTYPPDDELAARVEETRRLRTPSAGGSVD
jgi:tRNA pseudouridine38-40 synthase